MSKETELSVWFISTVICSTVEIFLVGYLFDVGGQLGAVQGGEMGMSILNSIALTLAVFFGIGDIISIYQLIDKLKRFRF